MSSFIYLDREMSRYEDTKIRSEALSEDTKAKVRGQKVGQESRIQKGCHEDESSEEPVAPGAWEF